MHKKPIVLLVSGAHPPYTSWGSYARLSARTAKLLRDRGYDVEVIAESDNGEEFMHLDDVGSLVHRISGERSYLRKSMRALLGGVIAPLELNNLLFAARVLEKTLELTQFWGREILWVETTNWRAEALFLLMMPSLSRRTVVRTVTPTQTVVEREGLDAKHPSIRGQLYAELFQRLVGRIAVASPEMHGAETAARFLLPFDVESAPRWSPRRHADASKLEVLVEGRVERWEDLDAVLGSLLRLSPRALDRLRFWVRPYEVSAEARERYVARARERFPGLERLPLRWLDGTDSPQRLEGFDAAIAFSSADAFAYGLVDLLASGIPVIVRERAAFELLGAGGVQVLATYRDADGLAAVLEEQVTTLDRTHVFSDNRAALQRIYADAEAQYLAFVEEKLAPAPPPSARKATPIRSVDIVCCTYNRFDELTISLPSILREAHAATDAGFPCQVYVVFQNEGFAERIYQWRTDWREEPLLRFVFSNPPGLTRARNEGIAAGSGDLVIFIDDDVVLEPGFVLEHVRAAQEHPDAVGVAGRLRSPNGIPAERRAVGQIRISGFVEPNFDSFASQATLVPHTPMGANMSYRRERMTPLYGNAWFDERMPPAAFRDETLLGAELFRAGEHLVYAPKAELFHFESASGGCGFRSRRPIRKLIDHFSMDYLFLNRLYEPVGVAQAIAPWLLYRRDLKWAQDRRTAIKKTIVNLGGVLRGRALYRSPRPERPATSEARS